MHKSHKWNSENRTKTDFNTSSKSTNRCVWILCDQLVYFLDTLRGCRRVWSSLPQFILNAFHLLKLSYESQNWRIWLYGRIIRDLSMKCLFYITIRARSIISFQHKNLFSTLPLALVCRTACYIRYRRNQCSRIAYLERFSLLRSRQQAPYFFTCVTYASPCIIFRLFN